MGLIYRLDAARSRRNILQHPFYVRWERGELSATELAAYAGEYRHAVVALARAAEQASPLAGREHAQEEQAHIELWDGFAGTTGADRGRAPLPETERCVASWTEAADPLEALAVLYALEAGQPEVSETKLAGLVAHYGYTPDTPATAYFELHAERDHAHAAEGRELLERHARAEDEDRLVAAGERALDGNWALLDGVTVAE
jgi:pyrroloquinoline-quinone synthase